MANSKTLAAYQAIKEMLITGALPPNLPISEEALLLALNMSRTPVREAIQMLTRERFFEVYPRKGIVVTDITLDLLNEIYDFRVINEPYIAQMACGKISDSVLESMRDKFCNPPSGNPEEKRKYLINLDSLLHATLLDCCPNRFLVDIMKTVLAHDARIKHFSYDETKNDSVSVPEHIDIIDSLLAHDAEKIRESVLFHVNSSREMVVSSILSKFIGG
ncbi:MAG: GntR family transcriptional regulator [Anaerotruncus sp.]|nr:GntR family transcriptional regulator [Anaerotruncus sp.]